MCDQEHGLPVGFIATPGCVVEVPASDHYSQEPNEELGKERKVEASERGVYKET